MPVTNLANAAETVDTSKDSIVIVDNFQSIRGGRSLNVAGDLPSVLRAGHVIIKETATGDLKPMPATEASVGNIDTLGAVTAGTGYANGTYENVPLTGGSGTGAKATVVVAATVVDSVTITEEGKDYLDDEVLSASNTHIGGTGSGFAVPITAVGTTAAVYQALPAGHTYEGILISSILKAKPMAGVMVRGTVNHVAGPYDATAILAALRAALPRIDFRAD